MYIVRSVFNNALYNYISCISYKTAYFRNIYAFTYLVLLIFVSTCFKGTSTNDNITHNAAIDSLLTSRAS